MSMKSTYSKVALSCPKWVWFIPNNNQYVMPSSIVLGLILYWAPTAQKDLRFFPECFWGRTSPVLLSLSRIVPTAICGLECFSRNSTASPRIRHLYWDLNCVFTPPRGFSMNHSSFLQGPSSHETCLASPRQMVNWAPGKCQRRLNKNVSASWLSSLVEILSLGWSRLSMKNCVKYFVILVGHPL